MVVIIDDFLETQYNNRAAVADHPQYLKSWASRSELFRQNSSGFVDLSYGASARQVLDVFPGQSSQHSPVHIFLHGGYWQALDKNSFSFLAQTFNQNNECAVIISYDLCPLVSIADIFEQIKQAILWIIKNIQLYGGDSRRLQISGHSAGAHLLAMLLTTDWSEYGFNDYPFQRMNGISGLYDLQPLLKTTVNAGLGLNRKTALQMSPLNLGYWKPAQELELNLLVGELESDQYKMQSSLLADSWQGAFSICSYEIPAAHHFSIIDRFLDIYPPVI